jgi:predicted DNA-binding protein
MYTSYIVKRTQIYLHDDQDRQLSIRASRSGTTKSALIREAIDHYLGPEHDEAQRLERFKAVIHEVAGIAPYLPDGAEYVEALRAVDAERQAALERQWRE